MYKNMNFFFLVFKFFSTVDHFKQKLYIFIYAIAYMLI